MLQENHGDQHGYDFFRRDREPKKCQISARNGNHPFDLIQRSCRKQEIRPTVRHHPCDEKAQQKAWVGYKLKYRFEKGFGFFLHLFFDTSFEFLIHFLRMKNQAKTLESSKALLDFVIVDI